MKITELRVEGYKRVKAVTVVPEGNVVQITGANASGKSSTLDAIITALGGKKRSPEDPVHHGAEVARITLSLGTIVVKWHCKPGKDPVLVVESADGARYPSPQSMLDQLYGELSFDPLEFLRMKSADQRQVLADLAGLTEALNTLRRDRLKLYEQRTLVNRDERQARAEADAIPAEEVTVVDTTALMAELAAKREANAAVDALRRRRDAMKTQADQLDRKAYEATVEAERLLAEAKSMREEAAKNRWAVQEIDESNPTYEDLTPLEQQITQASEVARRAQVQERRRELLTKAGTFKAESDALTADIERIDQTAHNLVAAAGFPVPGLSLSEDGVMFNGVPFAQASQAEKIRVSAAIARALNPKLRIVLIKDGSLLDSRTFKALTEDPEMADYQIWIERVDESGKVGIYLEDGEVAAVDGEPTFTP